MIDVMPPRLDGAEALPSLHALRAAYRLGFAPTPGDNGTRADAWHVADETPDSRLAAATRDVLPWSAAVA